MDRKLRMGMIGGGNGAFIGAIHRAAALMDNQIELSRWLPGGNTFYPTSGSTPRSAR